MNKNCMWLEMADFVSPQAMLHDIIASFALNTGFFQLHHAEFLSNTEIVKENQAIIKTFFESLLKFMGINGNQWVLFLYGRTAPGASSSWSGKLWEASEYEALHIILKLLGLTDAGQKFTVVYMPFTEARLNALDQVRDELFINAIKFFKWPNKDKKKFLYKREEFEYLAKVNANKYLASVTAKKEFKKFLETKSNLITTAQKTLFPQACNVDINVPKDKNPVESTQLKEILNFVLVQWLDKPQNKKCFKSKPDNLHFLYGLLLFRQSRHPNAILSDAVLRCPARFNEDKIDNDFKRQQLVASHMKQLYDADIFLEKPGGYAWIYRDVRTSLLAVLESIINIEAISGSQFDFAGQFRGRSHDWIADWYIKAFFSTGHILPLLESFFHRARCLAFMPFIKHGNHNLTNDIEVVRRDRILLAHKSLNQCYKHLLLVRPWLKYWLCDKVPMQAFTDKLAISFTDINCAFTEFDSLKLRNHDIEDTLCEVSLDEIKRRFTSLGEEITHARDDISGNLKSGQTQIFVPHFVNNDKSVFSQNSFEIKYSLNILRLQDTHLHRASLQKALAEQNYFCFREDLFPTLSSSDLSDIRRTWLLKNFTKPYRVATVISILSELAYIFVKRAKMFEHIAIAKGDSEMNGEADKYFVYVCKVCYEGLQLIPHLDASYLQYEVLWQSKLQSLYGLALAKLGRYFESHRRLNEAEAILSKATNATNPLELAKIRIRRAELFLSEADAIAKGFDDSLADKYTKSIDDAWSMLESVERLLASRSHSSLWWGRWIILSFRAFTIPKMEKSKMELRNTLPFIRVADPLGHVERLFEMSGFISENDNYRQCRFADYFDQVIETFIRRGLINKDYKNEKNDKRQRDVERMKRIKARTEKCKESKGYFRIYSEYVFKKWGVEAS